MSFPSILTWGMVCLLCLNTHLSAGELVTHAIESERLAGNPVGAATSKKLSVYLPDGYAESQQDYSVVYWFSGYGQARISGIDFTRLEDEFQSGRAAESIIVFMPSNELFGSSTYISSSAFGDWEGFLIDEVIPSIDATYRTKATQDSRGIMGFSLGGLTSMLMPILQPGNFGAVGANDPSTTAISGFILGVDEIPEDVPVDERTPEEREQMAADFFNSFPDTLAGYNSETPIVTVLVSQLAARLTPNAEVPYQDDLPFTPAGEWVPEVRTEWGKFDLLDPDAVGLHLDALEQLASVSVIIPNNDEETSAPWNREVVRVFQAAGLPAQPISFEGDHNDFRHERFAALLSNVSYALRDETKEVVTDNTYAQDFDDALGTDDVSGVDLPTGWSVTDGLQHVFRDSTNTAFNGGDVEPVGVQPHVLNVGQPQAADRGLAVYLPEDSEGATIQFLADISSVKGNALQLKFDLEAWDWLEAVPGDEDTPPDSDAGVIATAEAALGEVAFRVLAEIDFGNGFEPAVDFGTVTTGATLEIPSGAFLDGNASENRITFETEAFINLLDDAKSLRLRWTADNPASNQWVFGLDEVELGFFFIGDFDDDDLLTANDIDLLSLAIRENNLGPEFDVNRDGMVDKADHDYWVLDLLGTTFGDTNLDNSVAFNDFLDLAANFGGAGGWAAGDFDGDGEVQFQDFLLLAGNFGNTKTASESIPEPSASVLLMLAVVFLRRNKRMKDVSIPMPSGRIGLCGPERVFAAGSQPNQTLIESTD